MLPQRIAKPIQIGLTSFFLFVIALSGLIPSVVTQPVAQAAGKPNTIPALMEWTDGTGSFVFSAASRIMYNGSGLASDAATFAADLQNMTGLTIPTVNGSSPATGDIYMTLGATDPQIGTEGYLLTISNSVTISAQTNTGAFYGTRTMLQLIKQNFTIAAGSARDWPMYKLRGTHLDNGRKYYTPAWLRDHIREMSYLKMNFYHLHMNDREGFRVELFNHPEVPTSPYLTQAEVADLVALANQYHVMLVPEIDMPGHDTEMLRNHPELWMNGSTDSQMDLSVPGSYTLAADILNELMPLFPGPYWHIGADEYNLGTNQNYVNYAQANFCPPGTTAVAGDAVVGFVNFVNDIVKAHGKQAFAWHDVLSVPQSCINIDQDIIIDFWNADPQLEALPGGWDVLNSNRWQTYYVIGGTKTSLTKILNWNPAIFAGSTIADMHPQNMGGKGLHIWADRPSHETQESVANNIYDLFRGAAQKAWNSPMLPTSFTTVIGLVGRSPFYGEHLGTPTATPTRTNTPTGPTNTPTRTNTPVPPTNTPTNTPIGPTATATPSQTPTQTNTPLPPTNTPTVGPSPTPTNTPPPTNTPGPGGSIAFVKNIGSASCGATSNVITVPAGGVTAGNTLIARVGIRHGTPTGTITVTDSKGNSYTLDKDVTGAGIRVLIFSANVATALAAGDTITVNYPTSFNSTGIVVSEYSGISATNRVDTTGSATGSTTTPSASVTTTTANTLVVGAVTAINNPTYTEASGWTTDTHLSQACGGSQGNATNHAAYRVVSATGAYTYNPTLSNAFAWAEAVVAYK